MRVREIYFTREFKKQVAKLPKHLKKIFSERELIFRVDPFNARLKVHKLQGKDAGTCAFSVNYSYRIKFRFLADDDVLFIEIGTHDIYK